MAREYYVTAHWSTLIENLSESPQRFYELLEIAIAQRKVPDAKTGRTVMKEAGLFSAKREYLTFERKNASFDVCAAPFGTGFFVSWWQASSVGALQRLFLALAMIPGLGLVVPKTAIGDHTFYQQDTNQMFQKSIHSAVLEVIDSLTKVKGLRALSESERKPIADLQPRRMTR